jgi:hypothetical protein
VLYLALGTVYSESVKAAAQLLNEMCAGGVILNYALFGASAQTRYTEPVDPRYGNL